MIAVSPCDRPAGHDYEVVLRCRVCGFLIRVEENPHPVMDLRSAFLQALSRIPWSRFWRATAVLMLLCLPTSAAAQAVNATVDVGKVYSVPSGKYVVASMPGAELSWARWSVSGLLVLEGRRLIETDVSASHAIEVRRWTFSAGVNYYKYTGLGYDWTWSTGLKVRIK